MTERAVLAQGILHRHGGTHGPQIFTLAVGFDLDDFLAGLQHLFFDGVWIDVILGGAGPEQLADALAAQHAHVTNGAELLDLIEKHIALRHGACHHHARESRHGGVVHAEGKFACLIQGRLPVNIALPDDHPGPHNNQGGSDGGQELYPDFEFSDAQNISPHGIE